MIEQTDIEIEITKQCARLIVNAIIHYNLAILAHLLTKCEASGTAKAMALITRISPAAKRRSAGNLGAIVWMHSL